MTLKVQTLLLSFTLFATFSLESLHAQDERNTIRNNSVKSQERGTEDNPITVNILPSARSEERAKEEQEDRVAKRKSDEELSKFTGELASYTKDLARYTAVLVVVGAIQALILIAQLVFVWRQETATRTIEQAYVKISHKPPGLEFDKSSHASFITVQIKNFGRTPAEITDVLLTYKLMLPDQPLPSSPDYSRKGEQRSSPKAFLVPEEDFSYFEVFLMNDVDIKTIADSSHKSFVLFLYGYVDYIDSFGRRRRAGYAREYCPSADDVKGLQSVPEYRNRNNLLFVSQPGYNYDRLRKRGEGADWV